MRDALSALDQVLAFTSEAVTVADVSTVLGLIGRDSQFEIAEIVAREDAAAVFGAAGRIVEAGFDLRIVCRELSRLVRDLLLVKVDPARLSDPEIAAESERDRLKALADLNSREDLMRAFDLLSRSEYEIRRSSQPRHQFEMTMVEWIHLRKLTPLTDLLEGKTGGKFEAKPAPPAARPAPPARSSSAPPPPARAAASTVASVPLPPAIASVSSAPGADQKGALLAAIRDGNKMLYSMVFAQAQKVDLGADALVMTFAPQHKSLKTQLESKRAWIEQVAKSVTGRPVRLVAKDGESVPLPPKAPVDSAKASALRERAKAEPVVQNVLDVFGGEIDSVEEVE